MFSNLGNKDQEIVAEFDVFISYSHADHQSAERLSRRIRRYRPPRVLGLGRRRLSVFRDVERLTAHAELSDALLERIDGARNLLLICSPTAAQSRYVNDEVAAFLARKDRDSVQIVLAAGSPEAAFPPALKSAFREPLYIDMRAGGAWWKRSRRFREQSLRLIAALLKVDFAILYREDERRSRRHRWTAISLLLITGATIGSAWLASTVAADTWGRVQVPIDYMSNRLLAITEYAVNRKDSDFRLFRVFGAEYAAHHPANPIGIIGEAVGETYLQQFREAALKHLLRASELTNAWQPLANFPFTITHDLSAVGGMDEPSNPEEWGSGELFLHAFLTKPDGGLAFAWSLRYAGRNESGATIQMHLPPTAAAHDEPFRLEPWPASEFIRARALPQWGYLRGKLVTAWNPPRALSYRLVDAAELFAEANDGMWIESAIVTDGDRRRQVTLGGQSIPIVDLEPEAWDQLVADDAWATSRAPRVQRFSSLHVHRDETGQLKAREAGAPIALDPASLELLEHVLLFAPELDHDLTHVTRNHAGGVIEALTTITDMYNERTKIAEHHQTQYFIRRGNEPWMPLSGLTLRGGTTVIDVLPFDGDANRLLLLTDVQGFQITEDGGVTWRDFNHNEIALRNGALVRPLIAGTPPNIYALVDQGNPKLPNPLFRHVRRGWSERLRIALIGLLQPQPPAAQ